MSYFNAHFLPGPVFISLVIYLCLSGGLNYDEDYDYWEDAAKFNTNKVYKNRDPSQNYSWELHGCMLRSRAKHSTVWLKGQLFHIAGHAKDFNPTFQTGRMIEKWEQLSIEKECSSTRSKYMSGEELFNYITPLSFIVGEEWYNYCGV